MLYKNKYIYGRSFISFELKTFPNVYILWMASLFGYRQKKIIRRAFPVHFFENFETQNKYIYKISTFYKLLNNIKKKKDKKNFNLNIFDLQENVVGIFTGFKRKIRVRGIGYKFLLDQRILTLRIGFTHTFSILLSSLLYYRLNKKQTKILLKYNDFNKLTLFLSAFQNIKKPNVYSGKGIRYNLKKFHLKEGKKKKF